MCGRCQTSETVFPLRLFADDVKFYLIDASCFCSVTPLVPLTKLNCASTKRYAALPGVRLFLNDFLFKASYSGKTTDVYLFIFRPVSCPLVAVADSYLTDCKVKEDTQQFSASDMYEIRLCNETSCQSGTWFTIYNSKLEFITSCSDCISRFFMFVYFLIFIQETHC